MRSSLSYDRTIPRSLQKYLEKENQCPTGNFYTNKDKPRTNLSTLPLHDKPTKRSSSQVTLRKKPQYRINELQNINMIYSYARDYLNRPKVLPHCGFLSKHEVTCLFRAKMVDWMIQVMSSYKCSDRTLFKAIEIMDLYYMNSTKVQKAQNLHLVGVTSILIANKMEEVYPLKIKVLHEKIAHRKLSISEIVSKEAEIFNVLDYNVNVLSLLDCVEIVLASFCIEDQHYQKLLKIATYITKMVVYQYSLLSTYPKEIIGTSIVEMALRKAEDIINKFNGTSYVNGLKKEAKHNKNSIKECSDSILKVVRSFDSLYPNLTNFRKFNKVVIEGRNIQTFF